MRTSALLLVVLTAGAYLPSPLYPAYQQAFGFADLTLTLIYATFALVSAPALLLFGPASDTLGARRVLRVSLLLAGVGTALFALAQGPAWLLAGRALQGLSLGAATGAATTVIVQDRARGRHGGASALANTAFLGGTALGPVLAGLLAQYAPAPLVLPFWLHALALLLCWRQVSELTPGARRGARWRPTRPRVPRGLRTPVLTAGATGFLAWTVAGLFLALVPSVLARSAGVDNQALTGSILGVVLVLSVLVQPLVARCGAVRAQLAGLAGLGVALAMLAVDGGTSVTVVAGAALAAGLGHGLAYGGATTLVDLVTPGELRGTVSASVYLACYIGTGVPAVGVGLLSRWHSLGTAISLLGAVGLALVPCVVAALVLGRGPWRRPVRLPRTVRAPGRLLPRGELRPHPIGSRLVGTRSLVGTGRRQRLRRGGDDPERPVDDRMSAAAVPRRGEDSS